MTNITREQARELIAKENPALIENGIFTVLCGTATIVNDETGNTVYTLEGYNVVDKIKVRVDYVTADDEWKIKIFTIKSDEEFDDKMNKASDKYYIDFGCEMEMNLNGTWEPYSNDWNN